MFLGVLVAGGVFSQSMFSVGGGLMLDTESGTTVEASATAPIVGSLGNLDLRGWNDAVGAFVFADARFVEFSLGFLVGNRVESLEWRGVPVLGNGVMRLLDESFFAFNIGLLGKFPIDLGERVSIFPLLGFGLIALGSSSPDGVADQGNNLIDGAVEGWSPNEIAFRLQFGAGADFDLGSRLFLRTSLLAFYRFASSEENDLASFLDAIPGISASSSGRWGANLRLALGFRL